MNPPIFDIFQADLKRGQEQNPNPVSPIKRYFYVEHPTEGWRVYLRSCCFLHEANTPIDKSRFLVVKKKGSVRSKRVWEPPKGRMEGKDALRQGNKPVLHLLEENIRREVEEEAKINTIFDLRHTGLVMQSQEKFYPKNHYFQYHIFTGVVTTEEILNAASTFQWLHEHPKYWNRLRKDKREKDELEWFDPKKTQLWGSWSPTLVAMYLADKSSR